MLSLEESKSSCRFCSGSLEQLHDFGEIALTGVFLERGNDVPRTPLVYGRCKSCGLNQLLHNYSQGVLYGDTYGYESHLNPEMTGHLKSKAIMLGRRFLKDRGQTKILDIASNDGTFLSFFPQDFFKVGIDPLIGVVSDKYPTNATKIKNFFSVKSIQEERNGMTFDIVTSLSVFYDLEDPLSFAKDVHQILNDGGIWHLEQSYLPSMVSTLSFDTICHEHLLYYGAFQLKAILENAGFSIIGTSLNEVNGGSIAITAQKIGKRKTINRSPFLDHLIKFEDNEGYTSGERLQKFFEDVNKFRQRLGDLLEDYKSAGMTIFGLGASTKGNMLLQYCGINYELMHAIGEINPRKYGRQTPGTSIPIIKQSVFLGDEKASKQSIALVLPWHFKKSILKGCEDFLSNGGTVLLPLPTIEAHSF